MWKHLIVGLLSVLVISFFQPATNIPKSPEVQAVDNVQTPAEVVQAPIVPEPVVDTPKPVEPAVQPENEAKLWLFQHESSNNPASVNHIGCYGLGQDCNNQLAAQCPEWRTDRACQEVYWEAYMTRRYGSWEAAKAFWLARVPINGVDYGNWW